MPQRHPAPDALTQRLHVAVDARDLATDPRGIGTYARALVGRFARRDDVRLTLLVRRLFPRSAEPALRAALELDARAPLRAAGGVPRDADVVWHPWNGTFFAARVAAVATLHDLVPFVFADADATRRRHQQAPFERTAAQARLIVCDSASTARDAERYLRVEPGRLRVVPLGADPAFSPGPHDALPAALQGRRYVLHVGAHDPHKNTATLIAAHRAAFAGSDIALVLTRPTSAASDAIVVPNASRPTLVALYRAALLVACPSVYEGFGLPVLEAMACGAPVLASRAASLPEVGGDAIAYIDEPQSVEAWRDALIALSADGDRRAALTAAGPLRAARFSWNRCAEETLAVLRAAAAA